MTKKQEFLLTVIVGSIVSGTLSAVRRAGEIRRKKAEEEALKRGDDIVVSVKVDMEKRACEKIDKETEEACERLDKKMEEIRKN